MVGLLSALFALAAFARMGAVAAGLNKAMWLAGAIAFLLAVLVWQRSTLESRQARPATLR